MSNFNSSARLPALKVSAKCKCGKRYLVPAAKRGKKIACKACGGAFKVPRDSIVSRSARGKILADLGIDPEAAERNYKAEAERNAQPVKTYRCTKCDGTMQASDLKGAYIKGELVCPGCRASAEVMDRREEERKAERKQKDVLLTEEVFHPERAMARALGYGALFFVGVAGPLFFVVGARAILAVALGLVIALVGGTMVYRSR
jgi:DNA-directed RNA polymerase subunit M/transcription elongation factor TFIIS